jgi:hypothetical protein
MREEGKGFGLIYNMCGVVCAFTYVKMSKGEKRG